MNGLAALVSGTHRNEDCQKLVRPYNCDMSLCARLDL